MKQIATEKQAAAGGLTAHEPHVVFGGSFDPVHDGHLAVARAVRTLLGTTIHFLPAGEPVHRDQPQASGPHRLAMLQIAIAHERGFAIDTRELSRGGPSWTIDTVEALRSELPAGTPIVLVLGMDSLRQFTHWRRWQDILAQAHLIACTRPGQGIPTARELGELATHLAGDPEVLRNGPGGRILIEATTAANMTSTAIRAAFAARQRPAGVPAAVCAYIEHHALYRPQPQPTESRTRSDTTRMNADQLATLVKTALEDIKAQHIVILDVGGMTSIADRIVIASGTSSRHVKSIADRVIERVKEAGVRPLGIEGDAQTDWVLVDIGDVIVHVMTPATRQYYDLERLWSVGPRAAADRLGGERHGKES